MLWYVLTDLFWPLLKKEKNRKDKRTCTLTFPLINRHYTFSVLIICMPQFWRTDLKNFHLVFLMNKNFHLVYLKFGLGSSSYWEVHCREAVLCCSSVACSISTDAWARGTSNCRFTKLLLSFHVCNVTRKALYIYIYILVKLHLNPCVCDWWPKTL